MIAGLKPYPEYRDSGVSWLGRIPSHWDVLPNRAIFAEARDNNHPEERMLSVTIAQGVIPQKTLLEGSSKKDSSNQNKSAYKLVCPGDIAYNKMRAWQGAIGASGYCGIISPAYIVQRLRDGSDPRYFHWLYRTPSFAKEAERWSYGITPDMWSLRPEHFKMIYSMKPPQVEQEAIARFADFVNRQLESAIRAKKRLIAVLNENKQVIIHRAVTRGLDPDVRLRPSGIPWLSEIPEQWELRRLKWVARLQRGYDLPSEKRNPGSIPVVSSGGIIDTHSVSRATGPGVAMGRYGSTDSVFYIESDFWPHNTALYVTDFQGNDCRWCYYLLRTISKGDYAGKSAVPGVDRKDLYEIIVPRPSRIEQRQIAESIDAQLADSERATERVVRELDLIREYRTRLIADVVTGQLDVRAAADRLPIDVEESALVEPDEEDEPEELLGTVAAHG